MPEIRKTLVISTGHAPSAEAIEGLSMHYYGRGHAYGVSIHVAGETRPAWLTPILALAREHDCTWVDFDRDGDYVEELPRWDW